MELKNVNPNGGNVVASNLNNVNFLIFVKIVKIEFQNKHWMFFFLQDAMIVQNTKFLIFLTSLINIEWIKASHVDMGLFYKKK
jgi:hypothetical protein